MFKERILIRMSVEYYSCKYCDETFSDCKGGYHCELCGSVWCSRECAIEDGLCITEESVDKDWGYGDSCGYCRKEKFTDHEVLLYLMDKHNINFAQVYKEMKIKETGRP